DHESWQGLIDWLGMKAIGYIEPAPGMAPTPHHLVALRKIASVEKADFILAHPSNSIELRKWLGGPSGLRTIELPGEVGESGGIEAYPSDFETAPSRLTSEPRAPKQPKAVAPIPLAPLPGSSYSPVPPLFPAPAASPSPSPSPSPLPSPS